MSSPVTPFWPLFDQKAFLATVRKEHRRRRLLAVGVPIAIACAVLQYPYPALATSLLLVPAYQLLVLIPRWARLDRANAQAGAGADSR